MTRQVLRALVAPAPGFARLVWPLSLAQLISWGSIYYSFTLFLEPMEAELGLARTELTGALTAGLLVAGVCSLPVGALIDRGHARLLMTGASLLGGALLAAWSHVETAAQFFALWVGLGLVLAATLYEPAFAVLVRSLGGLSTRGIATMTLIAGFASTIFIPLTHLLIEAFGWRDALTILAALNVLVAAPIHWLPLSGERRPAATASADSPAKPVMASAIRRPAFWWLTVAFTAGFFAVSAITFHSVPMLGERGYSPALAVSAIALIGPAQVAGRILVVIIAPGTKLFAAGCLALGLPAVGLIVLLAGPQGFWTIALFAVCLGIGNGIATIARANAVAELLGRAGFGAVNGAINGPVTAGRALAPAAAAAIWSGTGGYDAVLWILTGILVLALLAFAAAIASSSRQQAA